jgi:hypothetical protein
MAPEIREQRLTPQIRQSFDNFVWQRRPNTRVRSCSRLALTHRAYLFHAKHQPVLSFSVRPSTETHVHRNSSPPTRIAGALTRPPKPPV